MVNNPVQFRGKRLSNVLHHFGSEEFRAQAGEECRNRHLRTNRQPVLQPRPEHIEQLDGGTRISLSELKPCAGCAHSSRSVNGSFRSDHRVLRPSTPDDDQCTVGMHETQQRVYIP